MSDLVLASGSVRRAELLNQVGVSFDVLAAGISEAVSADEEPSEYVSRMALTKASVVEQLIIKQLVARQDKNEAGIPILGADTVVVIDNQILGKPEDRSQAMGMLMKLSNQTHKVITGVAVKKGDQLETFAAETLVNFRKLTREECANYWRTGEPIDKAGAYAIQGLGAIFVSSISGSYSNVVGLPLMETVQVLKKFGIHCLVG